MASAIVPEEEEEESAYFSELLSYSLERLSKEPELLRADQEQLRRQLQDTAAGHYRSFIGTTRCLADLKQQLAATSGHLDDLTQDLPKLQATCDRFRHDAAAIATKRADNRQLYSASRRCCCFPMRACSLGPQPDPMSACLHPLPQAPTPWCWRCWRCRS